LSAPVYVLHCPKSTAPFLPFWYVLGIANAIPTLAEAVLGLRLKRYLQRGESQPVRAATAFP